MTEEDPVPLNRWRHMSVAVPIWQKYLPSDLSQRPGCSVASEGSGLSPRCVGSPCWSHSERGDSRLTQRTSPQSLPATERGHMQSIQLLSRQISLRTEQHLYEGEISTYVHIKLTFLLIMLFSKYLCNWSDIERIRVAVWRRGCDFFFFKKQHYNTYL